MEKFDKQVPLIKVYGLMVSNDEIYQKLIFQSEIDENKSYISIIYDVQEIIKSKLTFVNSRTFKKLPKQDMSNSCELCPLCKYTNKFYEWNWREETPELFVKYNNEFYNVIQFKVED